jgi:hypothetical protein
MPYFFCIRGDVLNVNIADAGYFSVTDSKNRTWLCSRKESGETPNDLLDLMKLQQIAQRHGVSSSGTTGVGVACDEPELPQRLGDK